MNFILNPNLPEREVKLAVVGSVSEAIINSLTNMSIFIISAPSCQRIDYKICTHPDMQLCHLGDHKFIANEEVCEYYKERINDFCKEKDCYFFNKRVEIKKYLYEKQGNVLYPYDCKMNSVVLSKKIITHTNNNLFDSENKEIIRVSQGYVKCSTCVVSSDAIITADRSIEKSAINNGIDVCLVTNETIQLNGYKNGFIGGTCGKISKNKLAFFGDVKTHPDGNRIIEFCEKYNVECVSLVDGYLYDYGSLLPIIEE